jgi:hypothetical protein
MEKRIRISVYIKEKIPGNEETIIIPAIKGLMYMIKIPEQEGNHHVR